MLFFQIILLCDSVSSLLRLCSAAVFEMHVKVLEPDSAESFVSFLSFNISLTSFNSDMFNMTNISALDELLQISA